jgi:hypothetical protein
MSSALTFSDGEMMSDFGLNALGEKEYYENFRTEQQEAKL